LMRQKVELRDVWCMYMRNFHRLPGNGDTCSFSCSDIYSLRLLLSVSVSGLNLSVFELGVIFDDQVSN